MRQAGGGRRYDHSFTNLWYLNGTVRTKVHATTGHTTRAIRLGTVRFPLSSPLPKADVDTTNAETLFSCRATSSARY